MDFYGTIVQEDQNVFREIVSIISKSSEIKDRKEIGRIWDDEYKKVFSNAYGRRFETQRFLEKKALEYVINEFHSKANVDELCEMMYDRWGKPPIFEESRAFFEQRNIPIYIVSNTDNIDINKALLYHNLSPDDVFTSEDARSYKPRSELFEMALNRTGLKIDEVIHIGDSVRCDIGGASALGMKAILINRFSKIVPKDVVCITNLLDAYKFI